MDFLNLKGKTTFITGASSGLSRRFTYTLAKVIICCPKPGKIAACSLIQSQGGQTVAFQMDVTSKESIQSVMEKITNQGKKIDTLINNAGTTKWTPLFPGSIEDDTFEKGGLEV
jgi:NAD(P)-dependent dehydrogenase (short-subunit alcohol dehydrogenase family)